MSFDSEFVVFLLLYASYHGSTMVLSESSSPDGALVDFLARSYGFHNLEVVCAEPWRFNKTIFKNTFVKLKSPQQSDKIHGSSLAADPSGVILCYEDSSELIKHELSKMASRSRTQWIVIHENTSISQIQRSIQVQVHQKVKFLDMKDNIIREYYSLDNAVMTNDVEQVLISPQGEYSMQRLVSYDFLERRYNLMGTHLRLLVDEQVE